MLQKLFIANRGEIAVRIHKSAHKMGIKTVAVYAEDEADALILQYADEAYLLQGKTLQETYLNIEQIIRLAVQSGATAVHPGYGFLAENAEFAQRVQAAGLIFVGPSAECIALMGLKHAAKECAKKAGLPIIPGYELEAKDSAAQIAKIKQIPLPIMLKAAAGGGGKGMRRVDNWDNLEAALAGARREALASFNDDRLIVEQCVQQARHIEVQLIADSHGQCVYLFERDCSVQRRHQKIIEEAPAPFITAELRAALGKAAVSLALDIGYQNAGTVEFLLDANGQFYFMEMNTRLQVEHPVTEAISGVDLVEWQLRVAAGEHLPQRQQDLTLNGHAFEARLYAEDPDTDFLPQTGTLNQINFPIDSPNDSKSHDAARVDHGLKAGQKIGTLYDPMLAKLIVWGPTRQVALKNMQHSLAQCELSGLKTNLQFLAALCAEPEFQHGGVDTGYLSNHRMQTLLNQAAPPPIVAYAFALAELQQQNQQRNAHWANLAAWSLNNSLARELCFYQTATQLKVQVLAFNGQAYQLQYGDNTNWVAAKFAANIVYISVDGLQQNLNLIISPTTLVCAYQNLRFTVERPEARQAHAYAEEMSGSLRAPLPGKIVKVLVKLHENVSKGAPVVVLEAMKMEHTILAPHAGCVSAIHYLEGDRVAEGADLLDLSEETRVVA